MTPKRCLIISCSKRKRLDLTPQPAVERYDGTCFRVLRRFLQDHPEEASDLNILVLSAEYGLVSGDYAIDAYDRRMTVERARELNSTVLASLRRSMRKQNYEEVFVLLGTEYLYAVDGFIDLIPSNARLVQAKGPYGVQARQLKFWLNRMQEKAGPRKLIPRTNYKGQATIHGCAIKMKPEQIFTHVRELLNSGVKLHTPRTWFVSLEGKQIGPKWIISQLTGLPLSSFTSREARRVLGQLGVDVTSNSDELA